MTSIHVEGPTKPPPVVVLHGPNKQSQTRMIMGPPLDPKVHMDQQNGATWTVADDRMYLQQNPYIQYSLVVDQKPANKPLDNFVNAFNLWSKIADTTSRNIWHNCPSISEAACGKINLTAKALNEGGFESLFKQSFDSSISRNEKLKKWFACYLSTTTGPVSGTLYLSNAHVAFCSDRPLLCIAPSGHTTYSHYKIMIPLVNIGKVNAVIVKENPPDKHIQIVTVDGHDFWFMGFVSFEKATRHLLKNAPHTHAYGSK